MSLDLFFKARCFAEKAHQDQKDDDGKPYFDAHVLHVVKLVKEAGGTTDMIVAAYLHDTIEDTDTTYEDLVKEFGVKIADLVNELTHEGTKDSYGYYFPRLKSRDAIVIKLADRMSNLMRMDSWDLQRQEHYIKKTKFWKDGSDR